MTARPAQHLVHGIEGPVVIVTGRVAAYLERNAGLEDFRLSNRGLDAETDQALMALHIAALNWRISATGSSKAPTAEIDTQSEWISTTEAASTLGLRSTRAIRYAIKGKKLKATLTRGAWRIHREDLAHYQAARRPD